MKHTDKKYLHSQLTNWIIECVYKVHRVLGSGFLESIYQNALQIELKKRGLKVQAQHPVKVYYEGIEIGQFYADLLIEDKVILELKAASSLTKVHEIQLMNYLSATGIQVGLLINFGDKVEIRRKYLVKTTENQKEEFSVDQMNSENSGTNSENKPYFVHPSAFIDKDVLLGAGTKVWHTSHLMSRCVLGEGCNIGQNVVISPDVILGNGVKVQNNVSIYTGVICEDHVFLGPSMVFTNVINPRAFIERKHEFKQTLIKRGATIGANATIVCGNTIGEYAMIGAGSVVTKDIPAYALVIGNPARQTGWVCQCGEKLNFVDKHTACPTCKARYSEQESGITKT